MHGDRSDAHDCGDAQGKSIVKQHQLVTKALEDEIAKWHGFVLDTKATS